VSIALFTFDIFGTVIDWRRGLGLTDALFDAVIDRQGELERGERRSYAEIVAQSLVEMAGLDAATAARIGTEVGTWPLFADSAEALRRLQEIAPCAAITNSDASHGAQVRAQLGFPIDWVCAEEVGAYKPAEEMWQAASRHMVEPFSRDWWHVSAYADYDLETARRLGLTCVFVQRPHSRPGPADIVVKDLAELAVIATSGR
jgi:HAD superfamily hydrolase (TIGR01493 family)